MTLSVRTSQTNRLASGPRVIFTDGASFRDVHANFIVPLTIPSARDDAASEIEFFDYVDCVCEGRDRPIHVTLPALPLLANAWRLSEAFQLFSA